MSLCNEIKKYVKQFGLVCYELMNEFELLLCYSEEEFDADVTSALDDNEMLIQQDVFR